MNKRSKVLIIFFGVGLFLAGVSVHAQGNGQQPQPTFTNPIGATSVTGLLRNGVGFMLGISGFLAMAALVWGGILYIVSLGNDQRVGMAKQIIMWAVVGLSVIFLSYFVIFSIWDVLVYTTG